MRLIYDLPKPLHDEVARRLADERILYCVPSDLSPNGEFAQGFVIVTCSRLLLTDHERDP